MSKKRRVFDIDFEETVPAGTELETKSMVPEQRRGPMASAIAENADALSQRQTAEAAIRAENDALAHEHVRLKKAGLITDLVPLDQIRTDKLTRDRVAGRDTEIDDLKTSIRDIGLSNPIRVERVGEGVFELIQGFRRLTAYRELLAETGDATYATIPAGIDAAGEDLLRLYRRMVDENLVRKDISFGEMAQLAIAYRAQDPNIESYDQAVEVLYASSGRQKRAYLKSFVRLLITLGDALKFPQALPRALGLSLIKRVEYDEDERSRLIASLSTAQGRTDEQEVKLLQTFLAASPNSKPKSEARRTAKTTFKLTRPEGVVKCNAADGKVELRLDRDFSGLPRKRLEAAVAAFFDKLDG